MITQKRLKDLMAYQPATGNLIWVAPTNPSVKVGDVAGSKRATGVSRVVLAGKSYRLSDLVWLWNFGAFPNSKLIHLSKEGFNCTKVEELMPLESVLNKPLTQKLLKATLTYDELSGEFKRINHLSGSRLTKAERCTNYQGYGVLVVYKRKYLAHRLAWLYAYGVFPRKDLDHIDHDKMNNSLANLREVTKRENSLNQKLHSTNSSGVTGVGKVKSGNWISRITVKGRLINLGIFHKKSDAIVARQVANVKYNFHENHGVQL